MSKDAEWMSAEKLAPEWAVVYPGSRRAKVEVCRRRRADPEWWCVCLTVIGPRDAVHERLACHPQLARDLARRLIAAADKADASNEADERTEELSAIADRLAPFDVPELALADGFGIARELVEAATS